MGWWDELKSGVSTATGGGEYLAPQAYYTITVPCIKDTDALSSTVLATAEAGLGDGYTDSATSARFNFSISYNSTLIAVEASCQDAVSAGLTRDNDAVLRQNGALVSATRTQFPDGGGSNRTTGLTTALLATDTLQISCETDSAATDGVVGGFVVLHLKSTHRAA